MFTYGRITNTLVICALASFLLGGFIQSIFWNGVGSLFVAIYLSLTFWHEKGKEKIRNGKILLPMFVWVSTILIWVNIIHNI